MGETIGHFNTAWARLRQRWDVTKGLWNDFVRWRFELERWSPLERQVQATQREMDRLAAVLAQVQRTKLKPK